MGRAAKFSGGRRFVAVVGKVGGFRFVFGHWLGSRRDVADKSIESNMFFDTGDTDNMVYKM